MTYDQFTTRYKELFKYFFPDKTPNEDRMVKYFKYLKYFDFKVFDSICEKIEKSMKTNDFARINLVAYCREDYGESSKDFLSQRKEDEDNICLACGKQGWVIMNMATNKPAQIGDLDTYVKKCNCREGNRLREKTSNGINADIQECMEAARVNSGKLQDAPF